MNGVYVLPSIDFVLATAHWSPYERYCCLHRFHLCIVPTDEDYWYCKYRKMEKARMRRAQVHDFVSVRFCKLIVSKASKIPPTPRLRPVVLKTDVPKLDLRDITPLQRLPIIIEEE